MPALIEYRCPRCRRDFPRDRFGETPAGARATLCLGCAASPRRRPVGDDLEGDEPIVASLAPVAARDHRFEASFDDARSWR